MGYNSGLGKINKIELQKLKAMSKDEVIITYNDYYKDGDQDEYYVPSPSTFITRLHDLGKGINYESEVVDRFGTRVFEFPEAKDEYYCDFEFAEITQEGFKFIIEYYMEKTSSYYQQLADGLNVIGGNTNDLSRFLIRRAVDWKPDGKPSGVLNFNESISLTHSWDYEYNAFNLLMIYKQFDWENDSLIIYGS